MAKLKLGSNPKTFKHTIKAVLVDGSEAELTVLYKFRTRTEFGQFLDDLFSEAKISLKDQTEDEVVLSLAEALAKTRDTNADYIMQCVEGWNLTDTNEQPVEFTKEKVSQLCDEYPGVAMAIINTYRTAITEGRRGN